jgi:hypothetical protein
VFCELPFDASAFAGESTSPRTTFFTRSDTWEKSHSRKSLVNTGRLVDTNRQFTAIQPVLSNHQNGSIVWIEELVSITAYVVAMKGRTSRALRADVHLPHKSSTGPELNLC